VKEGEGPRNVAVPCVADVIAVRYDEEGLTFTIFGKSAVKFPFTIHDDINMIKSSEII